MRRSTPCRPVTALVGVALVSALGGCGGAHQRVAITVTPEAGLYDRARTIVVSDLQPGRLVTVRASTPRSDGLWTSSTTFRAGPTGRVNLSRSAPITGAYKGISPLGVLWSERHVSATPRARGSVTVTTLTAEQHGRQRGSGRIAQLLRGPGVTERIVRPASGGFYGDYFSPRAHTRGPAVITWGGSEGGISDTEAELLASHGIPTLSIAYFAESGLPRNLERIPLENFVRAIRWLRARPGVDPSRVWLSSGSRGTEPELLVADHWPALVHGFVAAAPSSVTYGGLPCLNRCSAWTLRGKPLPRAVAVPGLGTSNADGSLSEVGAFRAGLHDPQTEAARIPLGRFRGPVLLISGGRDQLWPSATYARQIMAELRADPSAHLQRNYPRAGHVVLEIPYQPPLIESRSGGQLIALGVNAADDEAAHEQDWAATIAFIKGH